MSERHVTADVLIRLHARDLRGEELTDVLRHFAHCRECSARALPPLDLVPLRASTSAAEATPHLDFDMMMQLLEGRLDATDREVAEAHVELCDLCRAEVDDLRALAKPVPSGRRKLVLPIAASLAAAALLIAILAGRANEDVRPAAPITAAAPKKTSVAAPPVKASPSPAPEEQWVAAAVREGRLPRFEHPDLQAQSEILRSAGDAAAPGVVSPAGIVIDETHPLFRWRGEEGIAAEVVVFRGEREVARSGRLTTDRWRPAIELPRGFTYTWQVEMERDGETIILPAPPLPPARFHVLGATQHREVAETLARHRGNHLLHAVVLARYGLRNEAMAALRRAAEGGNRDAANILRAETSGRS